MYTFTSNGSCEWVRPVFSRDSKNNMIYERDIIEGNGVKGEVVWNPQSSCFKIQSSDELEELFIDRPEQYTVVGTGYELVDEL